MHKKPTLPAPEELEKYRRKSITGEFISRRELAKVFAALDAVLERARKAEHVLSVIGRSFDVGELLKVAYFRNVNGGGRVSECRNIDLRPME